MLSSVEYLGVLGNENWASLPPLPLPRSSFSVFFWLFPTVCFHLTLSTELGVSSQAKPHPPLLQGSPHSPWRRYGRKITFFSRTEDNKKCRFQVVEGRDQSFKLVGEVEQAKLLTVYCCNVLFSWGGNECQGLFSQSTSKKRFHSLITTINYHQIEFPFIDKIQYI